jgi:DNA-binding CsgD family transcriptional regulator/outer membrane protein assembly factor BamB
MLYRSKFYLIFICFFAFPVIYSQEFTPLVVQFNKNDYGAANQNWAVAQGSDGIMYFGNNNGLLQFDGSVWQLHKMPQNKIVRSLFMHENRIYAGSYEEFGYFEKDHTGKLKYSSVSDKLNGYEMQNDEIWTILRLGNRIIFQSFTSYFIFENGKVEGYRLPYTFLFFNEFKKNIYTHTEQTGFSRFDLDSRTPIEIDRKIMRSPVFSLLSFDSKNALVVTKSNGLFLYDGKSIKPFVTEADTEIRKGEINRALITSEGIIILGTILNGVTAIDKNGTHLWTLNTSNILQNNTVLGMHYDKDKNLWIALDKGIAYIQLNSSLRYIPAFKSSVGALYTLSHQAGKLLIGTNQGLYRANFDQQRKVISGLTLEPRIKGQVWNISRFDNQSICGNNEQTYSITDNVIEQLSPVRGGICIRKGIIHGQEVLVQGTYTDICIYIRNKQGKWIFSHTVQGFVNPIRYIEIDYTGTIWASHLYQGLYAIRLTADLQKAESIIAFKSLDDKNETNINVFSLNNRVVFTDHTGFYTYDDIQKKIIPYDALNMALGYFSKAYRISHFKNNIYWFILDGEAALVQVKEGETVILDVIHYSSFHNQTVDDYQNIIPVSENECLFTLENGLALYQFDQRKPELKHTELHFNLIQNFDADTKEYKLLPLSDSVPIRIPYSNNNIIFNVFYPDYSSLNNISFRFKLNGIDKLWSEPSGSARKVYNYLPHGEYELNVEVHTKAGTKLSEAKYQFVVLPPFYLSTTARIIYLLVFILLIIGIYLYIRRLFHIKKEKIHREQEEIRRKEIEKREKQIIALEKEKLESELTLKSKELASSTMTIIKKNEILVNIREEVVVQKNALGSQYPNKYYDKLIKIIDENISSEDDWAIFQTNFDRIHENFFRNLHIRYPELTPNDLRFCAYLRLNLSSKDIAHLMNISLKGVEVGRYRIRKKIGLPSGKSLTEFMIEFR